MTESASALPVAAILGRLRSARSQNPGAVLQAPPGAGKTTLVPLALRGQPWLNNRKILMLEPRRLAARAAADRMAGLLGEPVGHTVGYCMRMERRVGPETRVEVVTEGILTRMLQSDAALTGVGLVNFDEFHERSLQADLGLTLCLEIQGVLNTGLRLLVMSATLETAAVAAFMGKVPVIACRGRSHPVETRYGKPRTRRNIESRVAATIRRAAAAHAASILVFLPGAAEIGRVAWQLERPGLGAGWIVQPLFGRLTRAAQERAIAPAPAGRCKIVLASAIAETSLTIEGIRVVVDAGFMRVPRFDIRMAKDRALGRTACDLAALLSEGDVIITGHHAPDADLQSRLDGLAALRDHALEEGDAIPTDQAAARRVRKAAALLYRQLGRPPEMPHRLAAGRLMAWAYPDRIARRRASGEGRFLLASGRGAYVKTGDPLATREYIVAVELDGNPRGARIFLAAAHDGALLRRQFADRIDWQARVAWDPQHQRVAAVRRCRYGELVLHTEPITNPDPDQVQAALLAGVRRHGLECLPWTPALRGWQDRIEFLRRVLGGWPDFSDAGLTTELEQWLAPVVSGITRLRDLHKIDLRKALKARLDGRRQKALDRLAPIRLPVPSGRAIPVDYRADPPVLAVRLQEMFGQSETPTVAGGRQPLVVHLLSPAGRPVQITQDLAGFWQTGYKEVRKSLRGRYPKHHWPEDPLSAKATHRVRTRKS